MPCGAAENFNKLLLKLEVFLAYNIINIKDTLIKKVTLGVFKFAKSS